MDTGVERNGAGQFHVSPGGDDDAVAPANFGVHDELRFADRVIVEQRAHQAIHWIAPKVLGDR